ncbi:MAG: pyridoxamine 5'-phosphate oxidase family protein [Hyphomicrobiaceae bacterium]|nr:pyridoxamine 5'-phosphate oxidase family protein [Hyphomicrobiaceae bacterium]
MDTYAKSKLNKVRLNKRAEYDRKTVHKIIDDGLVAHVGFVDQDWPIVVPMIYARIDETLYLHGAKAARFAKAMGKGIQTCITVTHLDGLVLARSAFHSSVNYRSVVVHGHAKPVTDKDEKIEALTLVTDRIAPGRWDEAREMTDKELRSTGVISVPIEHAAAKVRTGGPIDDEEDYDLPIWGGVVPMRQVFDPPEDDGRLAPGTQLPESIKKLLAGNSG